MSRPGRESNPCSRFCRPAAKPLTHPAVIYLTVQYIVERITVPQCPIEILILSTVIMVVDEVFYFVRLHSQNLIGCSQTLHFHIGSHVRPLVAEQKANLISDLELMKLIVIAKAADILNECTLGIFSQGLR